MTALRTFPALGLITLASSVTTIANPVIQFIPISASGAHTINGNQITLDGPGQRIFLEVFISNWDSDLNGVPVIAGFQAVLDSSGYLSGALGQLVTAFVPCALDAECEAAFGPRALCGYPFHPDECTPGFQDFLRADWILTGVAGFPALDLGTPDFRWGGVVFGGGVVDTGALKYAGTLVLDVAVGTNGTFTLGFIPEPDSILQDPDGLTISPLNFVPAIIRVKCASDADCNDGNDCTQDSCNAVRGTCFNTPNFNAATECCNPVGGATTVIDDQNDCTDDVCNPDDGTVTHVPLPAGTACGDPSDTLCDNPDTCDGAVTCLPNLEPGGTVCRSSAGVCDIQEACDGLSAACPPDDLAPTGTACRTAVGGCDVEETCTGGSPLCPSDLLEPSGTVCRAATDLCDAEETCDGANVDCPDDILTVLDALCRDAVDDCDAPEVCDGVLKSCPPDVPKPVGASCGDPANTDCTNPDTCDGAGVCDDNDEAAGFACGDPSDTDCTDPDTCDGGGVCLDNHAPDGLVCIDDGNDCTNDVCAGGGCTHPNKPTGSACGDPLDRDCNNPDSCDGAGVCLDNIKTDGLICTDDGNDCTDDVCAGGGCAHPDRPVGTTCGDGSDTDCDNPDTCDGFGSCLGNLEPDGTGCTSDLNECTDDVCASGNCTHPDAPTGFACGDQSDTDCTDPDTCDGIGSCRDNHAAVLTACGDPGDTDCDNPDTCDGSGSCEGNLEPDGLPCPDDGNDCTADVCAAGACSHPNEPTGTFCGDPSDTDCTAPDTCSAGICLDNHDPDEAPCTSDFNDCTDDVCATGACTHPDTPLGVACGDGSDTDCDNPDTCDGFGSCLGNLEPDGTGCTSDLNECTDDVCASGNCTHPDAPTGFACGDQSDTDCTDPDTCDGIGSCRDNHAAVLTACGDPGDTDCDNPDTCDGSGSCEGNLEPDGLPCPDDGNDCTADVCAAGACSHPNEPTGTFCGDPSDTDCTAPDTCSAGICLDNHDPDEAPCTSDFNDCTDDVCATGACTHPDTPLGVACGDGADTDCDNPDTCDGFGFCDANLEPDGTGCTSDFNVCTDDVCDTGLCDHVNHPVGFACGDADDTECTDPDTCDGLGDCLDNHEASGTACGDPADTDCNDPDSCDGEGGCLDNHEPNDTSCEDGQFCNGEDLCAAGVCEHAGSPCGGPCDEENDLCLCEAPLVEAVGNRYLRITPQPPGSGPQAILVKPDCPAGVGLYVDPPILFDIDEDPRFIESLAELDDPAATPDSFRTPEEWGELYVFGEDITPETTYIVWGDCGSPGNPGLSDSTLVTTPRFGDAIGDFVIGVGWTGPDGSVNVTEVLAAIMTLVHAPLAPPIYVTDLLGLDSFGITCAPDQNVKLTDVITFIQAFQGLSYRAATRCPEPCP